MDYLRPPVSAGATSSSNPNTATTPSSNSSSSTNFTTFEETRGASTTHTPKPTLLRRPTLNPASSTQPEQLPTRYMNNSQLENFTNDHFSRSFNSLILDDIKDELNQSSNTSSSSAKKMKINKSPAFNVKMYNDKIDDFLDEEIELADENAEDDDDEADGNSYQSLNLIKPKRIYKSDYNSLHKHKSEEFSESEETEKYHSQQSSIKRSSKFLNLSIDSNLKTLNNKVTEDIDYISDLNEIDSSIIKNHPSMSREATPIENLSPISTRTPFKTLSTNILPSSNNKFKRPRKLVSQSPSPSSSSTVNASKSFLYLFGKSPERQNNKPSIQPEQSNLYSPSKLGLKGFKMFKNADKDAIISPNRSTPERRTGSSLFKNSTTSIPNTSAKLASSNKIRKTTLHNNKSPFNRPDSSPVLLNYEYYNVDDMEFDSPPKNRKLSNSSNNSIIIYQDRDNSQNPLRSSTNGSSHSNFSNHIPLRSSTNGSSHSNYSNHSAHSSSSHPPQAPFLNNFEFDDKENKSSYRFVKPLQTAFKSTGLVKKNSISKEARKLPPETPIKKNPLILINTNKSSLSNIVSSAHDDTIDEHLEVSIEVGRNNVSYNSTMNDSTSSFFRIPSNNNSTQKTKNLNILTNTDFDIDMSSDVELSIPETPTKSVKRSSSTPVDFSPVHFNKKASHDEPCTPTNLLFTKEMLPLKHNTLHNQLLQESTQRSDRLSKIDHADSSITLLSGEEEDTLTFSKLLPIVPTKLTTNVDDHLINKFGMKNIKYIGGGEFSIAYECLFQNQKFAIKRTKKSVLGKLERKAIMREIEALRVLTSVKDNESVNLQEQEEGKEYLVYFIEAWEFNHHYYIMTEYCDNGTLFDFLEENKNYKMDEFRIWKILIEILNGLKFIHSKNYLHLDLKPANIFITFEGTLKIGDFGLATKLPILEKDFDLEGDRNYIAPELINDKIYTPFADVFSLGLIILEIAANIILPDNGTPWRKLRSGDLSDAGKLSSDNISDFLQHQNFLLATSYNTNHNFLNQSLNMNSSTSNFAMQPPPPIPGAHITGGAGAAATATSRSLKQLMIPHWAPDFLVSGDSMNLDKLVNKMLRPNPFDRPNAKNILEMEECVLVENRRKAGATIFEGEFGPNDD